MGEINKQKSKGILLLVLVIGLIFLAGIGIGAYFLYANISNSSDNVGSVDDAKTISKIEQVVEEVMQETIEPEVALASEFADYQEIEVDTDPQIEFFEVKDDLSDVYNTEMFYLNDKTKEKLAKNSFVVTDGYGEEFFSLYEENRYDSIPNFITTDSILHNYHLMFNFLLKELEEDKLAPELKNLNAIMLAEAMDQYSELVGTEWENAAKRNMAFFAVGSKLLDDEVVVPESVSNEVIAELALIDGANGIDFSPVMNIGASELDFEEDYSQYIARGHYTKSEDLKKYFKSVMWYGRLTFRLKNEDEIKSAVLMTLALSNENNLSSWDKIYEPTNFFVGKSDDITYYQIQPILKQIYSSSLSLETVTSDEANWEELKNQLANLDPPIINSMPIYQDEEREEEIKGFRFMGQRYTVDAEIFQHLIDREVPGRMLPKGLDITAAMGSAEALNILEEMGETDYENYSQNMTAMQDYIKLLAVDNWTQNLYWGWLYSLKSLTIEKPAGYPQFMVNQAWNRKGLNSYLGSWTELKHDTILYAKQVYAELGGGEKVVMEDDRGYVEPDVYVYARLAGLLNMTKQGLEARELLSDDNKDNLERMEELVLKLKVISEKELNNQELTDDEYELIRTYGGQLEHFWLEAMSDEGVTSSLDVDQHPAALVADVATDPNGQVLEESIGNIDNIYVLVKVDDKIKITKGGVFSYYEFAWPMNDRLTDEKWQELLDDYGNKNKPKKPAWADLYRAN